MKNKKSLLMVLAGYVIWGVLPLYWHALSGIDPIVILCCRIVMSAVCTTLLLFATGRLGELWAVMRNKQLMKFLIPAALTVTVNWGVYIWAVSAGHVTDSSLGYYMNPLVVFLFGSLIFKERCGKMELVALLLAAAGVLLTTLQYGAFPYIAITLAVSFALYGMFKKFAHVDGTVSIAVETIVLFPAALLFLLLSPQTSAAIATATPLQFVFLLLAGIVTAAPLIMYTQGVNGLPFITMGFLQYVCPTLMLILGVAIMGEPFSVANAVSFAFIWAGLILFSVGMIKREKKQAALEAAAE